MRHEYERMRWNSFNLHLKVRTQTEGVRERVLKMILINKRDELT
jgi:hypothetical protein